MRQPSAVREADPVVGDAPLALLGGHLGHGGRIGAGEDHLRAGVEQRCGGVALDDRVVPGVDPAHVQRAFRAGLLHAQRDRVAQAQLLGDGEGRHIAELGVAIQLGAGAGHHAAKILHVLHRAEQVAEVGCRSTYSR